MKKIKTDWIKSKLGLNYFENSKTKEQIFLNKRFDFNNKWVIYLRTIEHNKILAIKQNKKDALNYLKSYFLDYKLLTYRNVRSKK